MFARVPYRELNALQQENYNFHKVATRLADYGFNCIRLSDDWQGADFIAMHVNGDTFLKVQLKGRMWIDRKYSGKNIHIAFWHGAVLYIYDHDKLVQFVEDGGHIGADATVWHSEGRRSWPTPPAWARPWLADYEVPA